MLITPSLLPADAFDAIFALIRYAAFESLVAAFSLRLFFAVAAGALRCRLFHDTISCRH